MIKDFLWNHFERTGDISAYLGFKEFHSSRNPQESEENAVKEDF